MKTFNFAKQTVSRKDGSVKQGRIYPVKAADDNSVQLRQLNALRTVAFNLTPLDEEQGKDGKDVSGAGVNSPSQIIWKDGKYIAVPYSDEYVRHSQGGGSDSEMNVAEWMANHKKLVGKPIKDQPAPTIDDPITVYDNRVHNAIVGRMKLHSLKSDKILTIDLTGVEGFGDEQMEDLAMANDLLGCNIQYVR